ncbi:MAG TPA: phosphoglucomutase/phosphomannomutase family protein [Chloroflexi bacterium]|nr:phosphoglucomutase/phosphomannomutase family protein [Chloroflexota bacterium]
MAKIKFGTDGWRAGIAEDYTFENVRYCAQGTADYIVAEGLAEQGMIVGYDTRFRSEDFARAVAEVLAGNGVRVYLADRAAPTPVLSYAILPYRTGGGIWITASHNPPTDNGYKLRSSYAGAAAPETLALVEERIGAAQESGRVKHTDYDRAVKEGLIQIIDPQEPYLEHLHELIDVQPIKDAGLRVVADPMWGVGQGWFPRILGGGKTQLNEIHGHRNPVFPEMQRPEPIVENLQTLLRTVPEWNAAAGVAFDGDADRVGFVSEQGVFINQLQVYALLAYYLLDVRGQRGPLVRTVSTTVMANKLAARYGVDVYETGVGFKYVAPEMIRVDALIGGEESGGFAFRGHMPERDGLLAGLYLLDLMVQTGVSPSGLLERIFELVGAHYYDRIDRRMTPEQRPEVLARVAAARPDSLAGLKVNEIDDRDGYRYVLEDGGWMLVRFSGTEPVIRVYCETTHEDKVQDLLAEGLALAGLSA